MMVFPARLLVVLGAFLFPGLALAGPALEACRNTAVGSDGEIVLISQDANARVELQCRLGAPVERRRYFLSNGGLAQILSFSSGQASEMRTFDTSGRLTKVQRFLFLSGDKVLRTVMTSIDGEIREQEELENFDPESNDVQLKAFAVRRWMYREAPDSGVDFIASYRASHPRRIVRKDYLTDQGRLRSFIEFRYKGESEKPTGFSEFDGAGRLLSVYDLSEKFDPRASLVRAGLTREEIDRRLAHQRRSDRFLMAVIDGGFDYNHPELSWKWWSNPLDPVDGLDNDGNGWVDDSFGWDRESQTGLPTESSTDLTKMTRPDSHGTHVAHIATRDLEGIGLIGFAGDYTRADYIDRVSAFLKAHKVKIVNISIGLPRDFKDDLGLKAGIKAHERMIRDNPETLFVVAAGNETMNLDLPKNRQYPASFDFPNLLKVGSLATDRIDTAKLREYRMSPWSNTGLGFVDILAPGENVLAARIGGGLVLHTGTSMSSPEMARQAARLWMQFPGLNAAQVKEAFLKSAHPMIPAPAIRSGGFVNFEGAVAAAREMKR